MLVIVKFGKRYCFWSTKLDRPVSFFYSRKEMSVGKSSEQLAYIDKQTTDSPFYTAEALFKRNRAGPTLATQHVETVDELVKLYKFKVNFETWVRLSAVFVIATVPLVVGPTVGEYLGGLVNPAGELIGLALGLIAGWVVSKRITDRQEVKDWALEKLDQPLYETHFTQLAGEE